MKKTAIAAIAMLACLACPALAHASGETDRLAFRSLEVDGDQPEADLPDTGAIELPDVDPALWHVIAGDEPEPHTGLGSDHTGTSELIALPAAGSSTQTL